MTEADCPVLRWQTPPLVEDGPGAETQLTEVQRLELGELRRQAHADGLKAGREEALQRYQSRIEESLDQLSQLLTSLHKPFDELSQQVLEDLARLAGKISKQLVRRELKTSPDAIMGVVREAISCLPEERDNVKVYFNDQDAELLREMSQLVSQDSNWQIMTDPTIERGDCLVTMGASRIDACLEARVNTIMAALLGGEREQDGEL